MAVATAPRTAQQKTRSYGAKDVSKDGITKSNTPGVKYVSRREGAKILDRQARKYLGMSGEEFIRRYHAGEIEDSDSSDVIRVAMLIPLAKCR